MQHSRRLILLADSVAGTRRGRDTLPLFFLIVCAEHASKRLEGSGKGHSAHHVLKFFDTCLTEAEKERLAQAFTATDGSLIDAPGAVKTLYAVRNRFAHEGIYWDFAFMRHPGSAGKAAVQAAITLAEFRGMVARGCIRAARRCFEPALDPAEAETLVGPAEHEGQQRSWAEQRVLHARYRHQPFNPRVPEIEFPVRDLEVLRRRGSWMRALAEGEIQPLTQKQRSFVDAANGQRPPSTYHEELWTAYTIKEAFFRVARHWPDEFRLEESVGDTVLYDGTWDDYADHDGERGLIAAELDEYAEDWAASDDTGGFGDDEENEEWDEGPWDR
ncbi:DUF413 domain-containing protein [Longimicrobium terrae]|uniref:Macrodomain Ori protein n=1 Tax=Longimicrobium terrae TaxID=1639882 RepID=A0A841GVT0_9BACT|nr:DUF413 domain-containing protein [Longimicrobium terrae]MBB4635534.1 uncharacterized protein YifE (UPF0438 family) [Longimicrobium terrae]MBB6069928.1 uncharacterized protein YifE (UPF0438 family) [Longimicrobium terrae]NNC32841.1 macrodomain Ori organization protein MaoP [Longimicrobium terrae]